MRPHAGEGAFDHRTGVLRRIALAGVLGAFSVLGSSGIAVSQDSPPVDPPRTGGAYWYGRYGCGACHGGDAMGTIIGPAIVGRADSPMSQSRITRQVRAPIELMPDYPPERLSDEQLAAIIDYIWSLEPPR